MIEQDTIRLLRECDAGIQMGVSAIADVMEHVENARMKAELEYCQTEHEQLQTQIRQQLDRFHDAGKSPNAMAKGMSRMKTNLKMALNGSDGTIAELMTDGCNMGVKSLSRFLNQYKAADERSKDITKRLIHLEAELAEEMRPFL